MKVEKDTLNVNLPWLLIIYKKWARDWFVNYSVKDFLANGDIYNNPHKYEEDQEWVEQIGSYRFLVTPQPIEKEGPKLEGYCYYQDNPVTGKMRLVHYEPTTRELLENIPK